ncbi:MAG: DUF58 domain-containing protein [Rhodospirillales bacterium]|nr:MAG: DUF58 domain-containing protein [Rhodospirillales bacterium]
MSTHRLSSDIFHRAEAAGAELPPLLVAAERVAATVSQGVHGRRRVGPGETFWQYRRYQHGDPMQRIDWRMSARSRHVFVRQTEWEAAQSVWLWRDASPSMDYCSRACWPRKSDRANLLLLALASLLARGGEHVALVGDDRGPAPGRTALKRLTAVLMRRAQSMDSVPPPVALPRFASLVIIGDLLTPLDQVAAMVGRFVAQGVRGHLLQVLDPAEETLPFSGRVRFVGTEGEGEAVIGRVERVRPAYAAAMAAHRAGLNRIARAGGWTFAQHHTSRPAQSALLALYLALSAQS